MNVLKSAFLKVFASENLIRNEKKLGTLPGTKELYGSFFRVAWPSMLESAVAALTGLVDTMMVGKLGDGAIAAVGLTGQPRLLVFAFFFALNVGITAVVSRKKGEGDRDGANTAMHTGLLVDIVLVIILFTAANALAIPLLKFAGASGENAVLIDDSVMYFRIVVAGLCVNSIGFSINAAQRACSNTRIAFVTSFTANAVNVLFNYLLINGRLGFPRLEIKGAAIATFIGNCAAAVISVLSVLKKNGYLRFSFRKLFSFQPRYLGMIGKVSSGAALEQMFLRIGFLMFAKIVAGLGTTEFATHQICMNLISLSFSVGDGLGVAASALVGQNLGKGRPDLSELNAKCARRIGLCISIMLFCLYAFTDGFLISLFSESETVISVGSNILKIISVVTIMQISQTIYTGCLRGAGDTFYTAVISFSSICLVRPLVSYMLCYPAGLGVYGAWIALFLDQLARFIASTVRFSGGKWKTIKLEKSK